MKHTDVFLTRLTALRGAEVKAIGSDDVGMQNVCVSLGLGVKLYRKIKQVLKFMLFAIDLLHGI